MPMIDVKLPKGALDASARATLSDRLIATLLKWEKAPDNEVMRAITWCWIHEQELHVGGRFAGQPHVHVLASVPEGALSERSKEGFVAEATDVVADVAGIPEGF